MNEKVFPVIDPVATGKNIVRLRTERGLSVRDLQSYFGFEEPQAIYKWQQGKSLPTVDNLYALGALLEVPMDEILVSARTKLNMIVNEQQEPAARLFIGGIGFSYCGYGRNRRLLRPFPAPLPHFAAQLGCSADRVAVCARGWARS